MSVLTDDEWFLLHRGAGHTVLALVADFEYTRQYEVSGWGGGTCDWRDGRRGWYQTTAKGYGWSESIVMHGAKPADFEFFLSWTQIKAWVNGLPTSMVSEAVALRATGREIAASFPSVYVSIGHAYAWDDKDRRGDTAECEKDRALLAEKQAEQAVLREAYFQRKAEHAETVRQFVTRLQGQGVLASFMSGLT